MMPTLFFSDRPDPKDKRYSFVVLMANSGSKSVCDGDVLDCHRYRKRSLFKNGVYSFEPVFQKFKQDLMDCGVL